MNNKNKMEGMEMTLLNIRPYSTDLRFLFPPSIGDFLPDNHIAHQINPIVETMDLSSFYKKNLSCW